MTIEAGNWPAPPSDVLGGIARGLERHDQKKAADLWAQMMRLSGQLTKEEIAAIRRQSWR